MSGWLQSIKQWLSASYNDQLHEHGEYALDMAFDFRHTDSADIEPATAYEIDEVWSPCHRKYEDNCFMRGEVSKSLYLFHGGLFDDTNGFPLELHIAWADYYQAYMDDFRINRGDGIAAITPANVLAVAFALTRSP